MADRKSKTEAADLIADAGRIMYGHEFIAGMAELLGVNERRIRHWLAGHAEPERVHLERARDAVARYQNETVRMIDAYLARKG